MGLEFTRLNIFKADPKMTLDVDSQVVEFVKLLDGKLEKWQVLAPSPNVRVLYYELENGVAPRQVQGSNLAQRMEHVGEIKKRKEKNVRI